jgi:hypothetical protein
MLLTRELHSNWEQLIQNISRRWGQSISSTTLWTQSLSQRANDGRTAYNKKVNCNVMYLNSTKSKGRKRTKQQRSSIWADPIHLPLWWHGVGIFSIPKFSLRLGLPIQTCTCNYILLVKSVQSISSPQSGVCTVSTKHSRTFRALSSTFIMYREPSVEVCGLCRQSQAKGLFSRIPMQGKPPQNCNTPRKNFHRIWSEV